MDADKIGDEAIKVANLATEPWKLGFDGITYRLYEGSIALLRQAARGGASHRRVCVATVIFVRGQARAQRGHRKDAARDYRKAGRLCRWLLRGNGNLREEDKNRAQRRLRTCQRKLAAMGHGLNDRVSTPRQRETRHAKVPVPTSRFARTVERYESKIAMLEKRARLYLRLGLISIVLFALVSCSAFAVLHNGVEDDKKRSQIALLPAQILLPALVPLGLCSGYFLRRHGGSDALEKYYHNEITNVEAKMEAVGLIDRRSDESVASAVISELILTERNPVLNKEQTTPLLEQMKLHKDEIGDPIPGRVGQVL